MAVYSLTARNVQPARPLLMDAMPKSLDEYAEWLSNRDLLWPMPPAPVAAKATPYLKPLPNIRGVVWNLYGTLLTISEGQLLHRHPQQLPMQIALDKTIKEFNMWNSMSRKPGAPWEYFLHKYDETVDRFAMGGTKKRGQAPEVNSTEIWRTMIGRLQQKDYQFDASFYGSLDDFCEKVAYFFHSCLQGTAAAPGASQALEAVSESGRTQGLLSDAQSFSYTQMLRALRLQGKLRAPENLFAPNCLALSYRVGFRKPSQVLFDTSVQQFEKLGIPAKNVLYISSRIRDDLGVAKKLGMKTALFAGDKSSLDASAEDLKDSAIKPDRLIVELSQIEKILSIS